jgi:hypothetical protein
MSMQEAYAARMDAQMRAADARLDQMEARARATNAKAEMDEVSGLRARRDKIQKQVAAAKKTARDDWESTRRRMDADWNDFRRDVADKHSQWVEWDDARERRLVAQLDEAEAALKASQAADLEVAADARVEINEAQQELRTSIAAAHESYDAWRSRKKAENLKRNLDDAEFELDQASNRYTAALADVRRGT